MVLTLAEARIAILWVRGEDRKVAAGSAMPSLQISFNTLQRAKHFLVRLCVDQCSQQNVSKPVDAELVEILFGEV